MDNRTPYVPPAARVVGTLVELTACDTGTDSDGICGQTPTKPGHS